MNAEGCGIEEVVGDAWLRREGARAGSHVLRAMLLCVTATVSSTFHTACHIPSGI